MGQCACHVPPVESASFSQHGGQVSIDQGCVGWRDSRPRKLCISQHLCVPWRVRAIFDESIDTGALPMGAKMIDSELPTQPRAWPGPLCITTTLAGFMPRRRAGRVNRLVKEALPTHIPYAGLINAECQKYPMKGKTQ